MRTFYTIPDIQLIDLNRAEELAQDYLEAKSKAKNSNSDDDDVDTSIPSLKGTTNWVDFRENMKN